MKRKTEPNCCYDCELRDRCKLEMKCGIAQYEMANNCPMRGECNACGEFKEREK